MSFKWFRLDCYWMMAVCATYGALWLGHMATGRSQGFQDLWDHSLASGTAAWFIGCLIFWRKGKGVNANRHRLNSTLQLIFRNLC